MALPSGPGLTPAETAFVAELELVTVLPRQALPAMDLLGGPTPALRPPLRANLPLWLALLLRRQGRANIVPPPWLAASALEALLSYENEMSTFAPPPELHGDGPPFQPSCTADASPRTLPYHWLEVAQLLLDGGAVEDVPDADAVRRLIRDLREARAAKLRNGVDNLEGTRQVVLRGIGGLEVCEQRGFVTGVVDGLRKIGASKEAARKEREEERARGGYDEEDDDDEDML